MAKSDILNLIQIEEYSNPKLQYRIDTKLFPEFKVKEEKVYYHYTSVDAGKNILSRGKNDFYELWASQLEFLNDREEYLNGLKLISDQINKFDTNYFPEPIKNDFLEYIDEQLLEKTSSLKDEEKEKLDKKGLLKDIYIICFCSNKNSLTQWKYYGKECGISMEFNLNHCSFSGFMADDNEQMKTESIGPFRVLYEDDEKQKIINRIINYALEKYYEDPDDDDRDRWLKIRLEKLFSICPLFKHKDFKDEDECRLIFRPLYRDKKVGSSKLFNYRVRNGIVLPYLKIQIHPETSGFDPGIIKSITVGPGENQELVYKSLRHMVIHKELSDVDKNSIKTSLTPFRG